MPLPPTLGPPATMPREQKRRPSGPDKLKKDQSLALRHEAQAWAKRLQAGRDLREDHLAKWRMFYKEIAGPNFKKNFHSAADPRRSEGRPLNLANNFVKVLLPYLLPRGQDLELIVSARKGGDQYEAGAALLAERMMAILRAGRFVDESRLVARDSLSSVGIWKVGLSARTGIKQEVPSEKDPALTTVADVDRDRAEGNEWFDADLVWACRVSPTRFVIDPHCSSLSLADADWVAHEVYRTVEALKLDPDFKDAAAAGYIQSNCKGPSRLLSGDEDEEGGKGTETDDTRALVRLWEIHDRVTMQVIYVPAGRGEQSVWAKKPWLDGIEGFPFVLIGYEEVDEDPWPNPPVSPTFDMWYSADSLLAHFIEMVKTSKTLGVYDPDKVGAEVPVTMANMPDGSFCPVPGWTQAGGQFVEIGKARQEHIELVNILKGLSDELSGVDSLARGTPGESDQTATAVQGAMQSSGVRKADMKGAFMDGLAKVIGKMAGAYLAHQDAYRDLILPLNRGGSYSDVDFSDNIEGEQADYCYEIDPVSVERVEPAIRQKRTERVIEMSFDPNLAQKLAAEGVQFKAAPLLERYMRELGEKNPEKYFGPVGAQVDQADRARGENAEMLTTGTPAPVNADDVHEEHMPIHEQAYQATGDDAIAMHLMSHQQAMYMPQGGGQATGPAGMPGQGPEAGVNPADEMGGEMPTGGAGAAGQMGQLIGQAG